MPDHPRQNPDPALIRPGEDDPAEAPSIRSEPHRSDDKSLTERAQDEADTLGDFA